MHRQPERRGICDKLLCISYLVIMMFLLFVFLKVLSPRHPAASTPCRLDTLPPRHPAASTPCRLDIRTKENPASDFPCRAVVLKGLSLRVFE